MPAPAVAAVAARGAATRGAAGAAARRKGAAKASTRKTQVGKASTPITGDMTAEQVTDELQHRRKVAASTAPDAVDEDQAGDVVDEDADQSSSNRSSGRRPLAISVNTKGGTGGGVVLGAIAYVVGLTYLRGGKPAVKQLLRAKFFNKVGSA